MGLSAAAVTSTTRVVELKVLSAVGMRQVLIALQSEFEQASGHRRTIEFESTGLLQRPS
jgi:ABC-type molybdate transport system substrate-binding protein